MSVGRGGSGGRIGAALRGMSLRARLLLVLAVLTAAGLVAADVATYAALRSSLVKRVDNSLDTSGRAVQGCSRVRTWGAPGRDRDSVSAASLRSVCSRPGCTSRSGQPTARPLSSAR